LLAVMEERASRTRNAIGNLLDNACRYGGPDVQIKVDDTGKNWTIEVWDNGPGIPAEQCAELLQRGTRRDEQQDGSGLGLSIAQEIADTCGGFLQLANTQPTGLKVTVWLPEHI
jgi:signal transduction histidine kinase